MDEFQIDPIEDDELASAPETPEDVAVLYTWANVHGGKYRDFSASRREYRAQQRHRMVEAQREAELKAAREREELAAREIAEARRLEDEASADSTARVEAEENRRRVEEHAERERVEAQKHVETAAGLKLALEQSQREMEEAHRRAEEQAARYAEADARLRAQQRGMQEAVPGETKDPYYYAGPLEPEAFAPGKGVRSSVPQRVSSERRLVESYHRSHGESSGEESPREESEPYGFSTSGLKDPVTSHARSVYHEVAPASAPHEIAARHETWDDTRERNREDERQRLTGMQGGGQYDDNQDDSYYDHSPRAASSQPPAPRPQQNGNGYDGTERRAVVRSEDSEPEKTVPEQSRARRRESASDVLARTARRPRGSAHESDGLSGSLPYGAATGNREAWTRSDLYVRPLYEAEEQQYHAAPHQDWLSQDVHQEPTADGENRPEWLVRDPHAAEHETAENRDQGEERRMQEDDALATSLSQTDAEPRRDGLGLMRSAYQDRRGELPTEPAHEASAEESTFEDRAAERREGRNSRLSAGLTREAASANESADPTGAEWPRVERRRFERSSGPRGFEALLHSSREYRVAARAAEQEQQQRSRSQSAPRDDAGRQDVRGSSAAHARQAPSPSSASSMTPSVGVSGSSAPDTLQQSRERVAARWFALKGLMGPQGDSSHEVAMQPARSRETVVPMLSVVSLSGGVGKTSLVATLGRSLSSAGEKVLLADAAAYSLLPYYFGARELRPDVVRTFSPPPGSTDAPVYMVNYKTDRLQGDDAGQAALVEEIARHAKGTQRVLLDLNGSSAWLARRLGQQHSSVLVPIAPDMSSVLSIQIMERFFAGAQDSDGRPISPYYLLNQFDASLPLHLDVREVLRRQLGDRLLPVIIRRAQSVSEALAEGMTVIDYAPDSAVTEDYLHLAEWVRNLAAPANAGLRSIRWSER